MSNKATMMNGDCRVANSTPHPPSPLSRSTAITVSDVSKSNGVARRNAWIKPQISVEQADESSPMSSPLSSPPGIIPTRSGDSSLHVRTQPYPKTPPASYKFHAPVNKHEKDEYTRHAVAGEDEEEEEMSGMEMRGKGSSHHEDSVKKDLLQVLSSSPRSHSLPLGVKMDSAALHRISSNSDETADSEGSPLERRKIIKVHDHLSHLKREDSNGSDLSLPDSCSSSDDTSSDGTADDTLHTQKLFKGDEIISSPSLEQEDDMFNDGEAPDVQEEADTKLINWACNDFVPACHQLLTRCSESRTKSAQMKSADVQADLRSLSNTITFFCSEQQQRLSQVFEIKPIKARGLCQSVSTQTFPRPMSAALMGSGESGESTGDRSYAVKVLRSASQSLIAPLLFEATQREGFTPNLHQAIIKALQKIAWKVEACLSFSNPNHSANIHAMIFTEEHTESVKDMMIRARPPAEPKLPIGPLPSAQISKRKVSEPCRAGENSSYSIVKKRRGSSLKERPGGVVLEPETLPVDLRSIGESEEELDEDDEVWKADGEGEREEEVEEVGEEGKEGEEREGREQEEERETKGADKDGGVPSTETQGSRNGTPNLPRRERIATEGEADMLSRPLSRQVDFGSIPNLDQQDSHAVSEQESKAQRGRERYFRPRAYRRTTVSLSRKEVQSLGLTVAKRVDESILDDIKALRAREVAAARVKAMRERGGQDEEGLEKEREREQEDREREWDDKGRGEYKTKRVVLAKQRSEEAYTDGAIEDPQDLDRVGHRLHSRLTKEFDRIRSASTSDILDSDISSLPDMHLTSQPSLQDGDGNVFSSLPPRVVKLVPLSDAPPEGNLHLRRMNSDSTVLSSSPQPSPNYEKSYTPVRRATDATLMPDDEWEFVRPEKRKSSMKGRAKEKVKKSLSSSGKFAHSLIKTARSLRNGSVSKQRQLSKSQSVEDLLDDSVGHKTSQRSEMSSNGPSRFSMSMSPTPNSPTLYDARTLPTKSSRMNTLARIMRGRSKAPRSNSFGKSDKHSRGASWHQADFSAGGITESIESVSRNAIHSVAIESEEQLLISVELASKLQKKQAIRLRTTSIIGKESSGNPWFQITVSTNIKQFGRTHYIILRPFKVIQKLCDSLSSHHGAVDLPRPDKKVGAKKLIKAMEDLLRSIAGSAHLRRKQVFVDFLMPDDEFGSFTENDHSEVSFERLMTFYTPDIHSGPPGSFPSVQMVPADHVPATPSPDILRKSSVTGHKKGSMHFMKRDGKEDPSTFVIQEEGEDALIVAYEDDRYVVVAGTFEKLVEQLACEEKPDPRFVTTFLLGYRHFAKALDFLTKLLDRFHMTVPPNATEEEMAYAEKWSYVIQLRVLDILTYWMKKCWPDLYRNPPVLEKVQEFATFLKATDDHNFQYAGTNIEKIIAEKMANSAQYSLPPDSAATFTSSTTPTSPSTELQPLPGATSHTPPTDTAARRSPVSSPKSGSSASSSPRHHAPEARRTTSSSSYCGMDICSIPAIQLARQLTLIELEFLRAIDIHELVVYTWDPNIPENKPYRRNLDAFIERFNKVSYWVASEICRVEDARLRGMLIEKFIEVAKYCHEYKNFNTTISVLSGLSLAAVRRLKRSWDLVNEKTRKWFTKLQPLTAPATNHRNYRRALASVHRRDPCIPYFGVFMRDLTFFNDGNKKRLKNGLYNFSKLRTMVYKFEELKRYQRSKYFFPPEDKTREFCRNLWCMSESELYDTSLRIEPREVPPETAV